MSLDPNKASYIFWIDSGNPNVIIIQEHEFSDKPVPDDFKSVQRDMEETFHTTLAATPFLHIDKLGGYHGYMERDGSVLMCEIPDSDVETAACYLRKLRQRQYICRLQETPWQDLNDPQAALRQEPQISM